MRQKFKIGLAIVALTLTACTPMTTPVTATENTLCRIWGESLPTRSHGDTAQTQLEIGEEYADFAAACPAHTNLIPGGVGA